MKKTLARVLCLFDYRATTGFATVSTNIVRELKRKMGQELQLDIVPINYFGPSGIDVVDRQERVLVPTAGEIAADSFCRFPFVRQLQEGDYDGYFIIQDMGIAIGMLPNLVEIDQNRARKGEKKLASLFYFPVDSPPLSHFFNREQDEEVKRFSAEKLDMLPMDRRPLAKRSLGYFDRLVTYTHYGKRELLTRAPWLKNKTITIPHGVDRTIYFPLPDEDRQAFRSTYFGDHAGKFIVINVNRNQFRKDIPTTLLAFRDWKTQYPEVPAYLYLHMHPLDEMGWDLRTVAAQLGFVEGVDYGFPPEAEQKAGASQETLRGIYNAADLYVTTTTGEGWGLTVVEAMACGCPVVAPAHTSLLEIGNVGSAKERLRWVDPEHRFCATEDSVLRWACNPGDVAEEIEMARQYGRHNRKTVEALEYTRTLSWAQLGWDWEREFRNLFFR